MLSALSTALVNNGFCLATFSILFLLVLQKMQKEGMHTFIFLADIYCDGMQYVFSRRRGYIPQGKETVKFRLFRLGEKELKQHHLKQFSEYIFNDAAVALVWKDFCSQVGNNPMCFSWASGLDIYTFFMSIINHTGITATPSAFVQ